jgi:hypothetical protein
MFAGCTLSEEEVSEKRTARHWQTVLNTKHTYNKNYLHPGGKFEGGCAFLQTPNFKLRTNLILCLQFHSAILRFA